MSSPTQLSGHAFESDALDYLQQQGLKLVARNFRAKVGEIDLIMRDLKPSGEEIVFVEVRARASKAFGGAAASVSVAKQMRIRKTAELFLLKNFGARAWPACRFDVLAIETKTFQWIRGAF